MYYRDIRNSSKAYTLLELMIVLVILVSIMAISWPSLSRRMKLVGPREAALQLKADLSEAREQAILGGEPWAVRIERGKGQYQIGPARLFRDEVLRENPLQSSAPSDAAWLADAPLEPTDGRVHGSSETTSEGSSADTTQSLLLDTSVPSGPQSPRDLELPVGMIFDDGFAHRVAEANRIRADLTPPPAAIPQNANLGMVTPTTNWKFAVVFQPNGQATESEIRLKEQTTQSKIRLRIRRFTGGITIDSVELRPQLANQEVPQVAADNEATFAPDTELTNDALLGDPNAQDPRQNWLPQESP